MLVDRSLFSLTLQLVALRIPARRCAAFKQRLSGHTFARPKLRNILPDAVNPAEYRLLLLSEVVVPSRPAHSPRTAAPAHAAPFSFRSGRDGRVGARRTAAVAPRLC